MPLVMYNLKCETVFLQITLYVSIKEMSTLLSDESMRGTDKVKTDKVEWQSIMGWLLAGQTFQFSSLF